MLYCSRCHHLLEENENKCPLCGKNKFLREVQDDDEVFLLDSDMVWSEVLADMLKENGILAIRRAVSGAGIAMLVGPGASDYRITVPYRDYEKAKELLDAMSSEDAEMQEEEEIK